MEKILITTILTLLGLLLMLPRLINGYLWIAEKCKKKTFKRLLALLLIGFIILCFSSCKVVDISGEQTVTKVRTIGKHQIVNLKGLQREFIFPTDTLKKGDVVILKHLK